MIILGMHFGHDGAVSIIKMEKFSHIYQGNELLELSMRSASQLMN